MHVRGVDPNEERLAGRLLTLNELHRARGDVIVNRLHTFGGEWTGVLAPLTTDAAEARIVGSVILVGCLAIEHAARTEFFSEFGILRIVDVLRLLLRVEVIEVSVKLVKSMHGRQEFVAISKMIFTELPGGVAERLQHFG